jgi:L-methionine (R)-S-oxide reductase
MESLLDREGKRARYEEMIRQAAALYDEQVDEVANMANIAALIYETFHFWWVGFYRVRPNISGVDELVLGPYQGPIACTRIAYGRGVCGTSWKRNQTIVVPDVENFPGHIACSSSSRSEIVIPLHDSAGIVKSVLDIDSERVSCFDETDAFYLEKLVMSLPFYS